VRRGGNVGVVIGERQAVRPSASWRFAVVAVSAWAWSVRRRWYRVVQSASERTRSMKCRATCRTSLRSWASRDSRCWLSVVETYPNSPIARMNIATMVSIIPNPACARMGMRWVSTRGDQNRTPVPPPRRLSAGFPAAL
jgi:hypothetical protein